MFDPEERTPVEQDVAQRTAAKSAQPDHNANADDIEPLARSRKQAGHSKGKNGRRLDGDLSGLKRPGIEGHVAGANSGSEVLAAPGGQLQPMS